MKNKILKRKALEYLICFLAIYLATLGYMYVKQRSFIYYPDRTKLDVSLFNSERFDEISVKTDDGLTLKAFYAPPEENKPVFVFFHGNAGTINHREYKGADFAEAGYGFLLAEYRGYGGNDGEPAEEGLYRDGRAYIKWLSEDQDIPIENIVLYGESIGSGVATQMASEYTDAKALVLEAPFTSLPDIGQKHMFYLPVRLLAKDRYDNAAKIKNIEMPLLVLHGQLDVVVPYSFGERLYKAANEPKHMESFSAGSHVNLHTLGAHERIIHFISGLK